MSCNRKILCIMFLFFLGCNEQSNPYILEQEGYNSDSYIYNLYMDGSVRDFLILEDISIESFLSIDNDIYSDPIFRSCSDSGSEFDIEQEIGSNWSNYSEYFNCNENEASCIIEVPACEERYWCKVQGDVCLPEVKDFLIVANDDESYGLLIYEIIEGTNSSYNLIYQNNEIEFSSLEENVLDTELRSLYYSDSSNMIYALDKFELVYSIFLPGLFNNFISSEYNMSSHELTSACPALIKEDSNNGSIYEFPSNANSGAYHATKFQIYEDSMNQLYPGIFILHKYNLNTNSDQPPHSQLNYSVYDLGSSPLRDACVGDGIPGSISGVEIFNSIDIVEQNGGILTEIECATIEGSVWNGDSGIDYGIVPESQCMEVCSQCTWDGDSQPDYGKLNEEDCSNIDESIWYGSTNYDYGVITEYDCANQENSIWYGENSGDLGMPDSACELPANTILLVGSDLWFNTDTDIGGFQFDVDGGATVSGGSGGAAQDAGFVVQGYGTTVLGFSFTPSSIPAGCGILTTLDLSDDDGMNLINLTFSDPLGTAFFVMHGTGGPEAGCGIDEQAECGLDEPAPCYQEPTAPCLVFSMGYNVSDFTFENNILSIANPSENSYSLVSYDYSNFNHMDPTEISSESNFITRITPSRIRDLQSKNDFIFLGLQNFGCYITTQNEIVNYDPTNINFDIKESEIFYSIADGFTVYDIQVYDNMLLLSCGSDGVLVYDWSESSGVAPSLIAHVTSSYAYKAKIFNQNQLMISTNNGIEIYYIGG